MNQRPFLIGVAFIIIGIQLSILSISDNVTIFDGMDTSGIPTAYVSAGNSVHYVLMFTGIALMLFGLF